MAITSSDSHPNEVTEIMTRTEQEDQDPDVHQDDDEEEDKINDGKESKKKSFEDIHDNLLYPKPFYCPSSNQLFTDPVVDSAGTSYERSVVLKERGGEDTDKLLYPNRALKTIIDERIIFRQDILRASLNSVKLCVARGISYVMPESVSSEPIFRPLNDAYYCPITFNLIHQPVIDPEGNTFEKVAIENWIRVNKSSPITRTPITFEELFPNTAIQMLLEGEKNKPEDQMHPVVIKWKDEPIPKAGDVELGGALEEEDTNGSTINVFYPVTLSEWDQREEARRELVFHFVVFFSGLICVIGYMLLRNILFLILFSLAIIVLFRECITSTHRLKRLVPCLMKSDSDNSQQ